jgi:hypothetical protein
MEYNIPMGIEVIQGLVSSFSDHLPEYTSRSQGIRGWGLGVGKNPRFHRGMGRNEVPPTLLEFMTKEISSRQSHRSEELMRAWFENRQYAFK